MNIFKSFHIYTEEPIFITYWANNEKYRKVIQLHKLTRSSSRV